jgi:glucosamine--fructose-6-phosphate aminotransferase (isomerizing)
VCGIVAVLVRPSSRLALPPADVLASLSQVAAQLRSLAFATDLTGELGTLEALASDLSQLDGALRGVPGVSCLLSDPTLVPALDGVAGQLESQLDDLDSVLDRGEVRVEPAKLESLNALLVRLRDLVWSLRHDRLGAAREVAELAGGLRLGSGAALVANPAALRVLWAIHVAFRSLDRLEVRGRDSAGLHLTLVGHGLEPDLPEVRRRASDPLFTSSAVQASDGCLSLVYKAAAEIGELGDNVAALRQALVSDPLLSRALCSPDVRATVLAHTRWASVGLISQANAHPLNSDELDSQGPYVIGALNGDVDNHAELRLAEDLQLPGEITTDAKLVPTLVSRHLAAGEQMGDAFRHAVGRFTGSVGIAVNALSRPDELYLALRGSGQGLNVGLAEDAFVIASEAYGLVEEAWRYVRLEGESGGQIVVCSREGAGTLEGIFRQRYDGTELPLSPHEVQVAEITTRDVDRRGFRHFLLKEISESPGSVRKTLRAKLVVGENGRLRAHLGDDVVPPALARALASGRVHEIAVIGQGTAAVAGQAVAGAIANAVPSVRVKAMPATELSGWGFSGAGLPDDMSGSLVVAISQSGTTTDTNRTVDLVRSRGAYVVAIVNRRDSDLVQKAHGVLYTSDGRDIEMSVASTKAFYSQVVAGHLLAAALGAAAGGGGDGQRADVLAALRELPTLMEKILAKRADIARIASAVAPRKRSWAVVGSGPDRVAAAEIRIKLSELCYKTISVDSVEDKKHIDLSAEPLIIVCAGSASGSNARDIAKEVEIFRAHKAAPVLIIAEGEKQGFQPGLDVVEVPACHPDLAFVLTAMVGHLFGYEAALSIDSQAHPLREARALLEQAIASKGGELSLDSLAPALDAVAAPALGGIRSGAYDGQLSASVAATLSALLRYASGTVPVDRYEAEMGKVGTPLAIATDLAAALSAAIDELTRPIDAIKHQAKTVTVGISRNEEALVRSRLTAEVLVAGATLESLGYRSLRTLAALGAAVEEVLGYTRYRIDVPPSGTLDGATIAVVSQGGVARGILSRTVADSRLKGTKHRAADKKEVTVFQGLRDGRTGIMVPEVNDGQVTGLTLLHARFADHLAAPVAKEVLRAYQGRYTALVDAVTEAQPHFDDEVLARVPVVALLTEPVALLARHWQS